ncbi:MAG: hypothetical protein ABI629_08425 [bacterium]
MRAYWMVNIGRAAAVAALALLLAAPSIADSGKNPMDPKMNPATGEPPDAPTGCCCYPKADPVAGHDPLCKSDVTEFDCKAECAELKDGREKSGCHWTTGACPTK